MRYEHVAVALLPSARAAFAEDAAPESDAEMKGAAEVVRVTERWLDADLFTVAHTSRTSTRRTVEPRGRMYVLGDILDGFPGVSVQRTGPGQGSPIVR